MITNECLKQSILGPKINEIGKTETGQILYQIPDPPYYSNFASELTMLIRESKYLDRLGFTIPEEALNVTLQESKYHHFVLEITTMLKQYDDLLTGLTPVETHYLQAPTEFGTSHQGRIHTVKLEFSANSFFP